MIIESILDFLQNAFFFIFSWLNIPAMPDEVVDGVNKMLEFLEYGSSFIGFFLPAKVLTPFFAIFFTIFTVDHAYPFIMWIVRKIPVSIN